MSRWAAWAAVAFGLPALSMIFVAARPGSEPSAVALLLASIAWLASVGLVFFSLGLSAPTLAKVFFGVVGSFSQRFSLALMVLNMGWAFKLSGPIEVVIPLLGSIALGAGAGRIFKYFNPRDSCSSETGN